MTTPFARTDNSPLGRWWWTVDRVLFASLCVLIVMGLFLTMAASPAIAERLKLDTFYFVKRHIVYIAVVVCIMVPVSMMEIRDLRRFAVFGYVATLLLLLITLFVGIEIKGARRWINFIGLSLQPSEFMKPFLVLLCAWMLAEKKEKPQFPGNTMALILYGVAVLFLLLQPDMGMIVLMTLVMFSQFFLAGLPLLWVFLGVFVGAGGLVSAYFLFPHVATRVDRFLNSDAGDKYTDRYQITQSLDAFMNGGFFGLGPGEGAVKKHLPDAHADFIFAVAAEEFGFILCAIILGLYALIFLRTLSRLLHETQYFIVLAVAGLMIEFTLQAMINMSSTMGLIPTKGMTLPFLSYGGSSMMSLAIGMGMVLGLTRRRIGSEQML